MNGSTKGVMACNSTTREITELILPEAGLYGELPEEIGYLSKLVALDFQNNYLHGTIPHSLGRLTSLRTLGVSSQMYTICLFCLNQKVTLT